MLLLEEFELVVEDLRRPQRRLLGPVQAHMIYLLKRRRKLEQGPEQAHMEYLNMELELSGPEQAHMIELYDQVMASKVDAGEWRVVRSFILDVGTGPWRTVTMSSRSCVTPSVLQRTNGRGWGI